MRKILFSLVALLTLFTGTTWGEELTYSFTPDATTTGSTSTSYITTATTFAYNGIGWSMNQWNPSTLQIKTNQSAYANEFNFHNTTAFPGKITKVVIKFKALTLKSTTATGMLFNGGTEEVTSTSGSANGVWDADAMTLTWTPDAESSFTFFQFRQNGKVASGTNYLADADAITVTYEGVASKVKAPTFDPASGTYYAPQTVTIASETEGASIKYSTNGTDYVDYTEPVTVSETGTLYAKALVSTTYSDWMVDGAAGGTYTEKYKVQVVDGVSPVNIQLPGFATEAGIYVTFPVAVSTCSVASDIDGAGVILHLSAFTAKETSVTVTDANGKEYTFKVYYADGEGDEPTAEESTVATATYTIAPAYASLADLVAAGAPTAAGQQVQVTLTDEKIESFYTNSSNVKTGLFLKSGDQLVELYKYSVPDGWAERGKISGTVTGKWVLYGTTDPVWELALDSWEPLTYTEPARLFTATDKTGKEVYNKYLSDNNPLTIKYNEDATGLTFKDNGKEVTYDATTGIVLTKYTAQNDVYDTIQVYNGETLVGEQIYEYIPVVSSVSNFKNLADGQEACMKVQKTTYVSSDGKTAFFEDSSKGIEGYNLGLTLTPYVKNSGYVWGVKKTYNNVVEICACDSTSLSTLASTGTTVDPTTSNITLASLKTANNQLRYLKVAGVKVVKTDAGDYYGVCAGDSVQIYDSFKTNVLASLETVPCFADVTCIVGCDKNGNAQVWPLAIENVSDKISGTSGSVTWTIDMDGNMVFTPTDGESGTLADLSYSYTAKNPWYANSASVKTVKFDAGVNSNTKLDYMFYQMANLESVDFTNFNTTACTSMKAFMQSCTNLKTVDLSALDLSKVTTFNAAFANDAALETITFGENTCAAATDFSSLYYGTTGPCYKLTKVDMHAVAPTAVAKVNNMFYACTGVKVIDLRSMATSATSTTSITGMFGSSSASYNYAAMPDTLYLSKNFGDGAAYGDAVKIGLPLKHYMAVDHDGKRVSGKDWDLSLDTASDSTQIKSLYAYNAALEDYGTYVTYVAPAIVATPSTETAVAELSTIALAVEDGSMLNASAQDGHDIVLKDANGAAVQTWTAEDLSAITPDFDDEYNPIGLTLTLTTPVATDGTYTLTIPAGTFWIGEDYTASAEATFTWTVDTATGINAVSASDNSVKFNIAGQRVNASAKGIIISNGKKYLVK